jgi:hypothetical protein
MTASANCADLTAVSALIRLTLCHTVANDDDDLTARDAVFCPQPSIAEEHVDFRP